MTSNHTDKPEPGVVWGDTCPEYEPNDRFVCPECHKDYYGYRMARHLVDKHGWTWWDNRNAQKPAVPQADDELLSFIKQLVVFISRDDNAAFFPDRHAQAILDAIKSREVALHTKILTDAMERGPKDRRLTAIRKRIDPSNYAN